MTEFELLRGPVVDSEGIPGVQGQLNCSFNGEHVFGCLTLENQAALCPAGRYPLKVAPMVSHGGVIRAELQDVPDHEGVFLHSGEKAADSRMCPLCGDSRPTPGTLSGGLTHGIAETIAEFVKVDPGASFITIKGQNDPSQT